MNVPFIDLQAQYKTIAPQIDAAIAEVVHTGNFILGKQVTQFEQAFARFCEADHAIGVDCGTSALELALRAYGVGPGDEVITTANTYIATAFAASHTGATPILVDVDPVTYNMVPELFERVITPRSKVVIPVHLYGQPADMDAILEIARRHHLIVIEDACQAHGARYKGRRVGSLGDAAAFSFYPAKNLGAYGDGGMVVTSDPEIAEKVRMLRFEGQSQKYYHDIKGYNHLLDTIQAAVLMVKLPHLDEWNQARRAHAAQYDRLLADSGVVTPKIASYAESVYHLYIIRVSERDQLQAFLKEKRIFTGIHYPIPIHLQKAYSELGYKPGNFPVTDKIAGEILSLPMYAELADEQIAEVAETIKAFYADNH